MSGNTNIRVHLILVTKYRRPILNKRLMDFCIQKIKRVLTDKKCTVIAIQGDDENHIHIMAELRPTQSISLIIQLLKQHTAYYGWKEFPVYLRKFYWYENLFWSDGYYCSTTGDASSETVKRYIENQGN